MDPGSNLERALFFFFFFFFSLSSSLFFPLLFYFALSLSARWFNTYQIQILFLSLLFFFFPLWLFFSLFFPPLTFPLPSFFFSFSYSFPIPFLLLVSFFSSPFCCFSFSLSSLSLFLPPPCPNACPTPDYSFKKSWGEHCWCKMRINVGIVARTVTSSPEVLVVGAWASYCDQEWMAVFSTIVCALAALMVTGLGRYSRLDCR